MKNNDSRLDEKRQFALDLARALAKMMAAEDYAVMDGELEQ